MIKAVFFDVANTLLEKPGLYPAISSVLTSHGYAISMNDLAKRHRMLSEVVEFPDKTSETFYQKFNAQLLLLLGIPPDETLLDEIFKACTYLPWKTFDDVESLHTLTLPKGVVSNWDRSLPQKLKQHVNLEFSWIFGSEELGVRKPDLAFFETMLSRSGFRADEVMYVGDSIKLDVMPSAKAGMKSVLIDRLDLYPDTPLLRITKMEELARYL
jgi:HAD superfamily hydrolase (TIGR01549 family)